MIQPIEIRALVVLFVRKFRERTITDEVEIAPLTAIDSKMSNVTQDCSMIVVRDFE